jgi:polar amino acid transport system substrate-binding protein
MNMSVDLVGRLAPTGTLRAAINLGNPILAHTDPQTGAANGVSVASRSPRPMC